MGARVLGELCREGKRDSEEGGKGFIGSIKVVRGVVSFTFVSYSKFQGQGSHRADSILLVRTNRTQNLGDSGPQKV